MIKAVKIGALVGMGPNSTSFFYDKVIQYARQLYGAKHDNDFPFMVMISLPTPFSVEEELNHDAMKKSLLKGIETLNQCDVDFIVIPCNVVHQYFPDMQKASNSPIINMVDLVLESLSLNQNTSTALITTESTVRADIYQSRLLEENINLVYSERLQIMVNSLLKELKAARISERAIQLWNQLFRSIVKDGAHSAIIACTDISPCLELPSDNLKFIDSVDLLAKATILEYMQRIA